MSREWSQYTHRPRFLALVTCTMMAAQVNVFAQGSNGRVISTLATGEFTAPYGDMLSMRSRVE